MVPLLTDLNGFTLRGTFGTGGSKRMATIDRKDVVATQSTARLSPRGLPLQWQWLLPITVSASVTAWLVSVSAGEVHGPARAPLLAAGALFTATAAGVPLWQQRRAAQAQADAIASAQTARAQMRIAMEDALEPFTALLLQLAITRGSERTRLRGEAIQLALTSIAQLSVFAGPEEPSRPRRVRVCLFLLDPGPPRQLVPSSFAGRSGAPTVTFDATTRAGQAMLRILDDGWVLVEDTDTRALVPWWDEEHTYKTYAAGPVPGTEATPAGVLTVDSLVPGELTGLDLPLLRLIAHLLSLALQM
jgi:ABC-type amino acid transport substrate-binding protein